MTSQCTVVGAAHLERRARAIARRDRGYGAHRRVETAGPLLKKALGADMLIAMEREPDERARAIHDRTRERSGVRIVHVGSEPLAVLPLFTHLRRGGVLGVQIDRAPSAMRSIPVRLFDAPARVPSGPFFLARATGAPVVPVFSYRWGISVTKSTFAALSGIPRDADDEALQRAAQDGCGGNGAVHSVPSYPLVSLRARDELM